VAKFDNLSNVYSTGAGSVQSTISANPGFNRFEFCICASMHISKHQKIELLFIQKSLLEKYF
jgi:hypothetical protein